MRRPSKSFEIALSAIACAVAAMALTLGSYVDFLLAAGYLVAVYALMVPLAKHFIWGNVLAFLAAVLLAFLFCGFAIFQLLPFAAFFGLHPLVNYLQRRYVKKKWLHGVMFFGQGALVRPRHVADVGGRACAHFRHRIRDMVPLYCGLFLPCALYRRHALLCRV